MKAEWLIYRKDDGRIGCIPATNAVKYFMKKSAIKTMTGTEAEAIAECKRMEEAEHGQD